MTDFRALCAELTEKLDEFDRLLHRAQYVEHPLTHRARAALAEPEPEEPTDEELDELAWNWYSKTGSTWYQIAAFRAFARAALARWGRSDGPAVPNGREPASVNVEPSDDELFRHFTGACKWLPGGDVEDDVIVYGLRVVLARWGNHPGSSDSSDNLKAGLTGSPAAGEVAELVVWLLDGGEDAAANGWDHQARQFGRAAELLQRQHPQPVPVSERLPEPSVKVLAHYFNDLGKGRTICAIWVPAKTRSDNYGDDGFTEYDEESDTFYWPEGWYETIENWDDFGYVKVDEGEVIYWKPLPKWPANALPLPSGEVAQ